VTLPLIARAAAPMMLITNDDIEDAFDTEDVEKFIPTEPSL
jgi:hypothetical protein